MWCYKWVYVYNKTMFFIIEYIHVQVLIVLWWDVDKLISTENYCPTNWLVLVTWKHCKHWKFSQFNLYWVCKYRLFFTRLNNLSYIKEIENFCCLEANPIVARGVVPKNHYVIGFSRVDDEVINPCWNQITPVRAHEKKSVLWTCIEHFKVRYLLKKFR